MDKEKREPDKPKNKAKAAQGKNFIPGALRKASVQKLLILTGFSLIVSLLITPSFLVETPFYQLGDIANRNIKAKRDFLVEDREATLKKREEAARQAPVVYDLDESVSQRSQERLEAAFQAMRDRAQGLSPTFENQSGQLAAPSPSGSPQQAGPDASDLAGRFFENKKEFEALLGFQVPEPVFSILHERQFSKRLQERIAHLLNAAFEQGVVSGKSRLPQVQGEHLLIRTTLSQEERPSTPPYVFQDLEQARKLTKIQALDDQGDASEIIAVVFLASQFLQPNLLFNLQETEQRRKEAYTSIKPVYLQIMKNEMLVREGQRVGPEELLKLRGQEQGKSYGRHFLVFITLFLFSGLCIWVFAYVAVQHFPSNRMESKDFLFLGIVLILILGIGAFTVWVADSVGDASLSMTGKTLIYAIPISAGGMIACIFFGITLSLIFSLLISLTEIGVFPRTA